MSPASRRSFIVRSLNNMLVVVVLLFVMGRRYACHYRVYPLGLVLSEDELVLVKEYAFGTQGYLES